MKNSKTEVLAATANALTIAVKSAIAGVVTIVKSLFESTVKANNQWKKKQHPNLAAKRKQMAGIITITTIVANAITVSTTIATTTQSLIVIISSVALNLMYGRDKSNQDYYLPFDFLLFPV